MATMVIPRADQGQKSGKKVDQEKPFVGGLR